MNYAYFHAVTITADLLLPVTVKSANNPLLCQACLQDLIREEASLMHLVLESSKPGNSLGLSKIRTWEFLQWYL